MDKKMTKPSEKTLIAILLNRVINELDESALEELLALNSTSSEDRPFLEDYQDLSLPFIILYRLKYSYDINDPNFIRQQQFYRKALTTLLNHSDNIHANHIVKQFADAVGVFQSESFLSTCIKEGEINYAMQLIARKDIDVNVPNNKPLYYAILKQDKALLRALLDKGAKLKLPTDLSLEQKIEIVNAINSMKSPFPYLLLSELIPALYDGFLHNIYKTIFIERNNSQIASPNVIENIIEVYFNNDGYLAYEPTSNAHYNLIKSAPLKWNDSPIGYNIYLPNEEAKQIMIIVYGGHNSTEDAYTSIPNENGLINALLNYNIAVITLNLPDLLELKDFQSEMSQELHSKIHACINYMHSTINNNPEVLNKKLFALKHKPTFLYGASFGGRTAIRHAELYPATFNGYISHDGSLELDTMSKNDLPLAKNRWGNYKAHLNPSQEEEIKKIQDPLLLMHNMDDNNVNIVTTLAFSTAMKKQNKEHLIQLCITPVGNKAKKGSNNALPNKGHFLPEQNTLERVRYIETLTQFMQEGLSKLPSLTQLQEYRVKKLANKFAPTATFEQYFIAEALESFKLKKHRFKVNQKSWGLLWKRNYKPLYYALYYPQVLATNEQLLREEINRLLALVQPHHVSKTLRAQLNIFSQYVNEMVYDANPLDLAKFEEATLNNSKMIDIFKFEIKQLTTKESEFIIYFLSNFYKKNPELLMPLAEQFTTNETLNADLEKAEARLKASLARKKALTFGVWRQTTEELSKLENHPSNHRSSPKSKKPD